ncbi:MAG: endonuclease III [Peptococcaceae bacterium BICA1-7]|nr:MAG: endonuclease III [Peptococcaceae bacterium BICA1-7]HBV96681.1 endonuclease III [Desulfotomaculum sp.]
MTSRLSKAQKRRIIELLSGLYPGASTDLRFGSTFQLLVAVMLSAQCTDRQVNKVTEKLFQIYSSPEDFAGLKEEELAREIKGVGLYRNKSKNIVKASRLLVENHHSEVPKTRDELESLPGVGRKTANVVLNVAFSAPVMPVDTHVFRVSHRLGLSAGKTPEAVEKDLTALISADLMGVMHHCLIFHGRRVCRARSPLCGECSLAELCPSKGLY